MSQKKNLLVLLVQADVQQNEMMSRLIEDRFENELIIRSFSTGEQALDFLKQLFFPTQNQFGLSVATTLLPLVIADLNLLGCDGIAFFKSLRSSPDPLCLSNHVLLCQKVELETLRQAFNDGSIQKALPVPWEPEEFYQTCKELLSQFILSHAFEQIEHYTNLVSHREYSRALLKSKETQDSLRAHLRTFQYGLFAPRSVSIEELVAELRKEFQALENENNASQFLRRIHAGEVLFHEGERLSSMWVIVEGEVAHRKHQSGDEELFVEGAGHILGSMAYFLGQGAFTSVIARKETEVALLGPESIDLIFARRPDFAIVLVNLLLRQGMGRVKQHVEQGHQLKVAIQELHTAEEQLIAAAKLATLGQLISGVAHELNNPAAAIIRGADLVADAVQAILLQQDQHVMKSTGHQFHVSFENGYSGSPASTRDIREQSNAFISAWRLSREDARMLAEMGFSPSRDWGFNLGSLREHPSDIGLMYHYFQAGRFLRNIQSSGRRVSEIVQSLRNYGRPVAEERVIIDVTREVEDSVVILNNRLKQVAFEKMYKPPAFVEACSGEIGQVVTNLLTNALDAVAGKSNPEIVLKVSCEGRDVLIIVGDNGCGMNPEQLSHIFEINYTTKKQGHFGLGLGLAICEKIINKLGGRIEVDSSIGLGSAFRVWLPSVSATDKKVHAALPDSGDALLDGSGK